MGGVNFTRNRAWWHTAVWDEYGQKHQYLSIFPTMVMMIPMYWYGSFINRDLEQNFAAKMYTLEYENKRSRMTHNMIMEHFELHVEKVQDILDQVKEEGFEKTFENEIKYQRKDLPKYNVHPEMNEEFYAEIDEHSGLTDFIDELKEHFDMPYWMRQRFESYITRRKTPRAPYKFINQISIDNYQPIEHVIIDPYERLYYKPLLEDAKDLKH
jgi:hypothetical protein